jgi:peptidoglycan/LPS O-acetylase OafA/YrhL
MTTINEEIAPSKRLISLDAVRGIAACIVVLSHCYRTIPEEQRSRIDDFLWSQPLLPLHNGDAAVFIFFVSSGYVLSLPYLRGTEPGYPCYVIRRVCRIYIPFAAAILFALLLYSLAGRPDAPAASQWFNNLWPSAKPGITVVAKHLLMLGTPPNMKLNAVMWTLVYELRISLLFPLLMILCRNSPVAVGASLVLLKGSTKALAVLGVAGHPSHAENIAITLLWTAQITPSFITGILLCKHRRQIHHLWQRFPRPVHFAVFAASIGAFAIPADFMLAKVNALYDLGAAMLIVLAIESRRLRALLEEPIPQWLGRIAYSIYLVHLPLMLAVVPLLIGRLPFGFVVAIVMASALTAATLMQILVEAPAIKLGHWLTRRPAPQAPAETGSIGTAPAVAPEHVESITVE